MKNTKEIKKIKKNDGDTEMNNEKILSKNTITIKIRAAGRINQRIKRWK